MTMVTQTLQEKVHDWLNGQGYPLEFRTTHSFSKAGFSCLQGTYAYDIGSEVSREVDVLARIDAQFDDRKHLFAHSIIECKYTRDHPWVTFASSASSMAPTACIAQSIANGLGQAVMHCLASDESLWELDLFKFRRIGSFGGCVALASSNKDAFYSSIQSVVSKVLSLRAEDDRLGSKDIFPSYGTFFFPVIVIDGQLFESFYNRETSAVELHEVGKTRVYWRGMAHSGFQIVPVDIVTVGALDEFAQIQSREIEIFLRHAVPMAQSIKLGFEKKDISVIDIGRTSRGYTGLPGLLAEIFAKTRHERKDSDG
jgi:hypothetical protein